MTLLDSRVHLLGGLATGSVFLAPAALLLPPLVPVLARASAAKTTPISTITARFRRIRSSLCIRGPRQ